MGIRHAIFWQWLGLVDLVAPDLYSRGLWQVFTLLDELNFHKSSFMEGEDGGLHAAYEEHAPEQASVKMPVAAIEIASLNFAEDRRTTWTRKLKKVCKEKRMPEIYDIVEQRLVVHKSNAHYFPQDCGRKRDLKLARHLHILMMQSGVASCCEQLIWLFTTCRCLAKANQVLDNTLEVNVLSLGALISAHGNLGGGPTALDLYNTMLQLGMKCDRSIYIAAIKACTLILALEQGRLIHVRIINSSLSCDVFLGTNLLDMYAKCGTLEEACQVFDKLPNRDVVSWTALIVGYTQHAKSEIALHCFEGMQHQDIAPNAASYLSILKACSNIGALNQGRHIHQQFLSFRIQSNGYLESALVDMYVKCGSLEEACKLFAKLPKPDVVSWGTMIGGCIQKDENILAVQIFERMQNNAVNPNRVTFLGILKAYENIGDIVHGRRINVQIIHGRRIHGNPGCGIMGCNAWWLCPA